MEPEVTPDGRYVVIDGRRWRATDPEIPEERRARWASRVPVPGEDERR
jgi:hypothetical protein